MSKVSVCFICDDNYVIPTVVAITSIIYNKNIDDDYDFYLVTNSLSQEAIDIFKSLENETCKMTIIEANNSERFASLRKKDFPVTTTALFKFELPYLLPSNLEKILYLDGDIIVQNDLGALFNENIDGVYAGVVKDFRGLTLGGNFQERLKITHTAYFNSGVLLLNLKKLRDDSMSDLLLQYRICGINYYMDQDAFNVVFEEKVKYLSFYYNFQFSCWRFADEKTLADYYNIETVNNKYEWVKRAVVLHYSADKPWTYYDYYAADIWLYYYLLSPLKNKDLRRESLKEQPRTKKNPEKYLQTRLSSPNDYAFLKKEVLPDVSVVMPVYNAERSVHIALNSLKEQSFLNFEVICVDDGSSDKSLSILKEYAANDHRIHIIENKRNTGAGVSRNLAINHARGNYIVFLDSDDALTKNALEKFYLKGLETDADTIISKTFDSNHVYKSSLQAEYLPEAPYFNPDDIPNFIFNFTHGGPSGKCVKTSFIKEKNIKYLPLARSEDIFFVYSALLESNRIAVIEEPLYRVNTIINPNSLEHTKNKTPFIFWDAIITINDMLREKGVYEKYKRSIINSNVVRCLYNINMLKNSTGYNIMSVKKMFVESEIEEKIITELELYGHEKEYFFVPEYSKLIVFLEKTYEDYIFEYSTQKDIKIKDLENRLTNIKSESLRLKKELKDVKCGYSFRIGRIITWLPRKLMGRK